MKIGIFSPYLPKHFGGGEKHILTTAEYLSKQHDVDLIIPTDTTNIEHAQKQYESFFDLNLSRVHWVRSALADRTMKPWETWNFTRQYDVILYATDGSVFLSGAKQNILHVQIPFTNEHRGLWSRKKLTSWNVINTNSEFTKKVIEKHWKTAVNVIHYPYVNTSEIPFPNENKRRFILGVGRFYDPSHTDVHAKRQDILIEAFKRGCKELGWDKRNWELHLVGAVEPDSVHAEFVASLQNSAKGFPIFFHHDIPHTELAQLYAKSQIFWHAAGYGIDEREHPEKVEHFGMSTIEAMAYGALPVVVNRGGLKETVDHETNGFRFTTEDELLEYTTQLMNMKPDERAVWQQRARKKAEQFSLEKFQDTIEHMLRMK